MNWNTVVGLAALALAGGVAASGEPAAAEIKEGPALAPAPVTRVAPIYPRSLRERRVEGRAIVLATVSAEGEVLAVRLQEASHKAFGDAALRAVKGWHFGPMEQGPAQVRVPVRFVVPQKSGR